MSKPYKDYEDDESVLPVGGDRRLPKNRPHAYYCRCYYERKKARKDNEHE